MDGPKFDASPCKNGGWTDWVRTDGTAFADQDACVAYVARGGTLTKPVQTPFNTACLSLSGQYAKPLYVYWDGSLWGTYVEGCTWSSAMTEQTYYDYGEQLFPTCGGSMDSGWAGWGWAVTWMGCNVGD